VFCVHFRSGVVAADSILAAIQKLSRNTALKMDAVTAAIIKLV
jgi:hypothetical protein